MADLIEVRRRILTQTPHLETASGQIAVLSNSVKAPLKSLRIDLEPMQSGSGDPSPTNVRPIYGATGVDVNVIDGSGNSVSVPVSWESQAGTVYGGYVDLVSGELTITYESFTFDGSEPWDDWGGSPGASSRYNLWLEKISGHNNYTSSPRPLCSHYTYGGTGTTTFTQFRFNPSSSGSAYFAVMDPSLANYGSLANFTAYLAEQNNNGTPVQLVISYKTPVTVSLTPQQIKAFRGNNCVVANNKKITAKYWTVKAANKTIGGLPVVFDNARYQNTGTINSFIVDPQFFITGVFDAGTPDSKSITYS